MESYCRICKKNTATINVNRNIDLIKTTYWGRCKECGIMKKPLK